MGLRTKYVTAHSMQAKQQTALLLCVPWWNPFTHFILRLTLLSATLCAIGSTLGAATGLFRAGGMSTLHSLSEWRLTTCGAPPYKYSPSGLVLHAVWDPRTATHLGVHRCVIKIFPCSCTYGDAVILLLFFRVGTKNTQPQVKFLFLSACVHYV